MVLVKITPGCGEGWLGPLGQRFGQDYPDGIAGLDGDVHRGFGQTLEVTGQRAQANRSHPVCVAPAW